MADREKGTEREGKKEREIVFGQLLELLVHFTSFSQLAKYIIMNNKVLVSFKKL